MERLRLLSFNIHGGRSRDGQRDLRRVHTLMQRFDIDIAIFQEMETRPSRGGAISDLTTLSGPQHIYNFTGPSMIEDTGWYGNLAISRYPITQGLLHDLETDPGLEPRNAIDVFIQTPLGKLRIIGTHLSLSPLERWSEAQNLLRLVASVEDQENCALLIMGDINEWQRPSRLLRFLNRALTPVPCKPTFPSWLPLLKLDRVWHKAPDFKVTAHRLSGRGISILSDHLPLLIEISPAHDAHTIQ